MGQKGKSHRVLHLNEREGEKTADGRAESSESLILTREKRKKRRNPLNSPLKRRKQKTKGRRLSSGLKVRKKREEGKLGVSPEFKREEKEGFLLC